MKVFIVLDQNYSAEGMAATVEGVYLKLDAAENKVSELGNRYGGSIDYEIIEMDVIE